MHHEDFCKLCDHPLLASLSPPELAEVRKVAVSKGFRARTQVLTAGERCSFVYLLLSGSVKLFATRNTVSDVNRSNDDREVLVSILEAGDFIGAISVLSGQEQVVSVMTIEATRVALFHAEDFLPLLEKHPLISRNLNVQLAQTVQQLTGHSLALSTLDVPGRLAFHLLQFARRQGQLLPDNTTLIAARLTQNDLAHLCGASREQVNRILKNWQRQNLVSMQGKSFLIHNFKALEQLAR